MTPLPVTVIIPTLDGGELFGRVMNALQAQQPGPRHVLVIDSESTDGSDRVASDAGAEVLRIARRDFDHGRTRQLGVERATTELVAFLSQDALPQPGYLASLAGVFHDPRLAGASARILPHPDSSPLARRTVLASPAASAVSETFEVAGGEYDELPALRRRELCRFDNVASMARRDVLLKLPFPSTMMGEDAAFAQQSLRAGLRLAFVAEAVVHHAHEYGPATAFRRYAADARWVRRQFDVMVRPTVFSLLKGIAYEMREDYRYLRSQPDLATLSTRLRSPLLRTGQVLGQWWGSRGEGDP